MVDKEPLEIDLKYKTAKYRYENFLDEYGNIEDRLKQHQIASYLGITPYTTKPYKKSFIKRGFSTYVNAL